MEQKTEQIVLHVGRDDEVKDYNTLIKSFKIVKEESSSGGIRRIKAVIEGSQE